MEERREFERVKPVDDCIVVHSKLIGTVWDISRGGLFCSCFQETPCGCDELKEIDILCGRGSFLVQGLKVKVVERQTRPGRFLRDFEIKKCRMQFAELREEQSDGIESILAGARAG